MTAFRAASVSTGMRTLTSAEYTSEAVFQDEVERLFAPGWMAVARVEALERTGDFVSLTLLGEPILLTRDATGIRGFYNVCRHRGSLIRQEPCGRFPGQTMTCPYHAWTYGLDGRLVSARNMDSVEGFDVADFGLAAVGVAEWEGFVFVSLDAARRPFEEDFGPVLGRFARWGASRLRVARTIEYDVRANWKQLFENYSECYHCPLIHPALARLSPSDSGLNDLEEGPFLGGYMTFHEPDGALTTSGRTNRAPLPGLPIEDQHRVYYYSLMPNLFLSLHADYVMAHLLFPESARRTRVTCMWLFEPEAMSRPGFDPEDAVRFWDETNRQDWEACERSLPGLASRSYRPGPYAHAEGLLAAFGRAYRQRMGVEPPSEP